MSSWRHEAIAAPLREWHEIDSDTPTVEVPAGGLQRWLTEASAGSDHGGVGAVYGAGGRVPDSIVAGGYVVNEPCCAGQDFSEVRWETWWHPQQWPAARCAGCGLDTQPDIWLDMGLDPETVDTDQYGRLVSCRLPTPEAFSDAAERAFGECLDEHRRRAAQRCAALVEAISHAAAGRAGTAGIPDWVAAAPIIGAAGDAAELRQFQPAAMVTADSAGAVTVGFADFAELGEQGRWASEAAFVGPEPSTVAAGLRRLWLPADVDDDVDAWWGRVEGTPPNWLTDAGVQRHADPPQRSRQDSDVDPVGAFLISETFF